MGKYINSKYDSFWKKVKSYIDKKNEHLSQLTYEIQLRNEQSEKKSCHVKTRT